MKILGLDPSLTKYGYCTYEYNSLEFVPKITKGSLKTSKKDDFVSRFTIQRDRLISLIERENPDYIGIETPVFKEFYSEGMYALFIYSCEAIKKCNKSVLLVDNNQTKGYVSRYLSRPKGWKSKKEDMIEAAKKSTSISKWTSDEADAYWVAYIANQFWNYKNKTLKEEDLEEYVRELLLKKVEFKKGKNKGKVEMSGLAFKENEKYFLWGSDK